MMTRKTSVTIALCPVVSLVASLLGGCGGPNTTHRHDRPAQQRVQPPLIVDVDKGMNPWTNLELRNDPLEFQFMVVTDRTGFARRGVFRSAMGKINLMLPEFVVSVGDLIEGYTKDEAELRQQWEEIDSFVDTLEMPFFYLAGNHDYGNEASANVWKQRLGRSYYYFVYRNVLFLALNTMHAGDSTLGDDQVQWAKQTLERFKDVRWTIVLMHHPLFVESETRPEQREGWNHIEASLREREHTVFAGHLHRYAKYEKHDQNYYVLATTGGGSSLRGPTFGEFDHAVWVTMTPQGPRIANLALDGILPDDIFTGEQVQLSDSSSVSAVAYTQGQDAKGEVSATVVASNETATPMTVEGHLRAEGQVLDPQPIRLTVPAESEQRQEVKLNLPAAYPVGSLLPAKLDWTARFQGGQRSISGTARFALETRYASPAATGPVTIDGDLAEWSGVAPVAPVAWPPQGLSEPEIEGQWSGPKDLSFDIATSHDAQFLYLQVRVRDDLVQSKEGTLPWSQDGLLVRLDARAQPNRKGAPFRDYLLFLVSPGAGAEPATFVRKELLPKGTTAACRRSTDGYVFEARVPIAYLNAMQKRAWEHFRLGVRAFDKDADEAVSQVYFRPGWGKPRDYWDSGMFYKGR
ncbi:MAG: metallophosphoesterase [Myxococcales bacterium]|nr:metallophosphoesterase [Myxococcales bacterium]MDD9969689.1 metallophosphoesterase [Myxococcales bacterium]